MHSLTRSFLAVALLASVSAAHAHRTWLLPSAAQVDGKDPWVTVDAAVSEDLFELGANALKLDGLSITDPDGGAVQPNQTFTGKYRSSLDLKLAKSGTYRISLVSETAMASYKLNGEMKRWRGNVADLKKEIPAGAEELSVSTTLGRLETFVTAGKPNATALKPVGSGLELIPLDHPSEFLAGQPARFRLLLDGQPLPGLTVAVVPGGVKYRGVLKETALTTDAKGEFTVNWPMPQMYWINAGYPARVTVPEGQPRPPMPAKRYNYSGTFEVLPQ